MASHYGLWADNDAIGYSQALTVKREWNWWLLPDSERAAEHSTVVIPSYTACKGALCTQNERTRERRKAGREREGES